LPEKREREIGSDKPSKKGQGIRRFHEFTSKKKTAANTGALAYT